MKFTPEPYKDNERDTKCSPFCSGGIRFSAHKLYGANMCQECGIGGLTTESSDHMYTTTSGHVLLCLKCAEEYKEFYELARLVNA